MVIFTKSRRSGERVFASIGRYLTRRLKLVLNHDKSSIRPTEAVEYLGYTFHGFGGRFGVSDKNLKARMKAITRRTGGRSIASRLQELRRYF